MLPTCLQGYVGSFLNQGSPFLWPLPLHCSCTLPCTHRRSLLYPANLIQCSPMGQEREGERERCDAIIHSFMDSCWLTQYTDQPAPLATFRPGVRTSIEFPKFESISYLVGQTSGMIDTDIISESLIWSSCLFPPRLDIQNEGSKVNSNVLHACAINDLDFFMNFARVTCFQSLAGNSD